VTDVIWIRDMQLRITYISPSVTRLRGYSVEEAMSQTLLETLTPASQEVAQQAFAHALTLERSGEAPPNRFRTLELEVTRKDGSTLWMETHVTFLRDAEGRPVGLLGVNRDISARKEAEVALQQAHATLEVQVAERTAALQHVNDSLEAEIAERQQAEMALRESEERYRSVVEGSLQGILIHQDGVLQYVNPACTQMFGYASPDELQGANLWETLFAPESWEAIQARIAALLRGESIAVYMDFPGVRKDGSRIWISSTGSVITWHHQLAVVSFYTDVTVRKQAEEERQRLEAQLRQSHKMEAIGTLAGGIAHEFNNALSAILGFTELTQRDMPFGSRSWSNLQEVLKAGNRSKDFVQQILAFSHPGDHRKEPVHLPLVIQEAFTLLRASLPTTIEIRHRIAPEIGTVLADVTQLHQVLMNLCANAEYALRGTGGILEISVDTVEVDDTLITFHPNLRPGSHIRVRVRDTGAGIPAEVIDYIFDPFFTTKGVGEGTGMGLAIVHGIIISHGGAITVESALEEGSTFTIYLPQIAHDPAAAADPPEPFILQGTGRILFVDDEEVLARLGQALLEHLGYDVAAYTNSLDALKAFQAEPYRFDLVITDQTMPAMTGATLVEELRRIRSDIPIILCTGFSHLVNAEKAEALGVDAFVTKPGVTQELAVTIQQVLGKRDQRKP
jgi:PAS domain S-box-containing protein